MTLTKFIELTLKRPEFLRPEALIELGKIAKELDTLESRMRILYGVQMNVDISPLEVRDLGSILEEFGNQSSHP